MLADKHIVLGVTGSIAAYKAAEIASRLTRAGARVDAILTRAACQFVSPLTFQAITGRPVTYDMFALQSELSIEHVGLARRADLVLIAPATANTIARLAYGLADDVLTATVLATSSPIVLAPAMDAGMYENPATQDNLARLRDRGFTIVGPGYGRLASGAVGIGRLAEMDEIIGTVRQVLGRSGELAGRRIVVTAGPTQEPIDPVRFISNPSSGKMGYALAEVARDRGAEVVLISGPVDLVPPIGVEVRRVRTAEEMRLSVMEALPGCHALLMAAAVSDYRPSTVAPQKIKKQREEILKLELVQNPDILAQSKGDFVRVGFAAESENLLDNARAKLLSKDLDLIVANDITSPDSGFGSDTNRVFLIDRMGQVEALPLLSKVEVAEQVIDRVVGLLKG